MYTLFRAELMRIYVSFVYIFVYMGFLLLCVMCVYKLVVDVVSMVYLMYYFFLCLFVILLLFVFVFS